MGTAKQGSTRQFGGGLELARALSRTWTLRGVVQRSAYELRRRSGRLVAAEQRWLGRLESQSLELKQLAGLRMPRELPALPHDPDPRAGSIDLYGGLPVEAGWPPRWHRNPVTGHSYDPGVHWSCLGDDDPEAGDIKDVWELSRLVWLGPVLQRLAATGDPAWAELVWEAVEDWCEANPPYLGPNWMCGQETSLRAISVLAAADALASHPSTTDVRRRLVADLVARSVGRVRPTIGYALSQRNNHALSEAAFLWTAPAFVPGLPDARAVRSEGERALRSAVRDQFGPDGSYAQHSPTYQRLAVQALLWCEAIARATGARLPEGVHGALERSFSYVSRLQVGGDGQVPNMGGNDGARMFDLAPTAVSDFRPVLAHMAGVLGLPSPFGAGPWDAEAAWFAVEPAQKTEKTTGPARRIPGSPERDNVHVLVRRDSAAVLRAGPLRHRPAQADQLHVDVWLAGRPVAVDAGSYRYTAPAPWGNALAAEEVHNLVRLPGRPQATRRGRFLWTYWSEARVARATAEDSSRFLVAVLRPDAQHWIRRLVAAGDGWVGVVDHFSHPGARVRWNLLGVEEIADDWPGRTLLRGTTWSACLRHGPGLHRLSPTQTDPGSGWHSPTYGVLEPLCALEMTGEGEGRVMSCFVNGADADPKAATNGPVEALEQVEAYAHAAGMLEGVRLAPARRLP